jgi:hypothetical protein
MCLTRQTVVGRCAARNQQNTAGMHVNRKIWLFCAVHGEACHPHAGAISPICKQLRVAIIPQYCEHLAVMVCSPCRPRGRKCGDRSYQRIPLLPGQYLDFTYAVRVGCQDHTNSNSRSQPFSVSTCTVLV